MVSEYVERHENVVSDDGFLQRVQETVIVKLKPCPHCGHPGKTVHLETEDGEMIAVKCQACRISTAGYETHEEAAMAWNKRRPVFAQGKKGPVNCAFCNGKSEVLFGANDETEDMQCVECERCGAHTEYYQNGNDAVKRWNMRI